MINEFQKWGDKQKYDRGYLKIFGTNCPRCNPKKLVNGKTTCIRCGGLGWVKKN